jgi:hypothetical protein
MNSFKPFNRFASFNRWRSVQPPPCPPPRARGRMNPTKTFDELNLRQWFERSPAIERFERDFY